MSWSDYLNPKHDWSDRWHPILVRELRLAWKGLRLVLWLGYPASVLLAWWINSDPTGRLISLPEMERVMMPYAFFAVLCLGVPQHVSRQLKEDFQQEAFEELLLTSLSRESIQAGYVQWGTLQLVLYSGLALPWMLVDCWLQRISFMQLLLIVWTCWVAGWGNCVILISVALQKCVQASWWDRFGGAYPLLLMFLTLGAPALVLLLLPPFNGYISPDAPLRKWYNPQSDPAWVFWLALFPWTGAVVLACRFITRWTAGVLNRYRAK